MYETLFRGKPKSNDEYYCFSQIWEDNCKNGFVYGLLIVKQDRYFICVSTTGLKMNCCINNSTVSIIEVIPETVGQYIGSTDRHGNKIFEGNIVKLILDNGEIRLFKVSIKKVRRRVINHPNFVDAYSYVEITGVVFEWNGFQLFPCIDENGIVDYSKMEIVGNIHDNPELVGNSEQLKEGKQKN